MTKKKEVQKDRHGKEIKVGCKVRYKSYIWEVEFNDIFVNNIGTLIGIFREKKSRLYPDENEKNLILDAVKGEELEVINKK